MIPLLLAALLQTAASSVAAPSVATQTPPDELNGAWSVDLTTDPAQPYIKPMHLTLSSAPTTSGRPATGGTVAGDFYDSDIVAGRWKMQNGRLCVSFRTTDGVGPYHTAACRVGDHIEGQTWAEHRNFVFVWTAARPAD